MLLLIALTFKGAITISPMPPIPPVPIGGGHGGSGYSGHYAYSESHDTKTLEVRKKRIKKNEEEWMLFIKIFLEQCQ